MPGYTVSRGLQELLQHQRRESEQLRQQHQRDLDLQKQQWRKEDQARQQQQRYEQQMVRQGLHAAHQSTRQMFHQHAQQGLPSQLMMQVVKQDKALWDKLQPHHKSLESAAGHGATSEDMYRLLERQQEKIAQRQQQTQQGKLRAVEQRHQRKRMETRHDAEQSRGALRSVHKSESLGLRGRQDMQRLDAREEEQRQREEERHQRDQQRKQQRKQQARAREEEQRSAERRAHLKSAGLSLARGDMGGAGMNAMSMMGGGGAGIAAAASALHAGADKIAHSLETLNNAFLTSAQKSEKIAEQYIPGFSTWQKFRDALNGVSTSMQALHMRQREDELHAGARYETASRTSAARAEMGHHQNLATAYRGGARVPNAIVGIDRSTYQGELAYREAATRLPHQAAIGRAEAELKAAQQDYNASKGRALGLENKRTALQDRMGKAAYRETVLGPFGFGQGTHERGQAVRELTQAQQRGELPPAQRRMLDPRVRASYLRLQPRSGAGPGAAAGNADAHMEGVQRTAAGTLSRQAQVDALNNEKLLMEEINRQKKLGATLSEKESALRRANNNLLKADVDLLKQKEQRQSTAAKSLGTMNPAQRAMALAGVKMAMKSKDIGTLPPALRGLAQQIAPGMMGKLAEQSGLRSKEYKELQKLGAVDKGDLAQTRKDIAQKQVQVEVNIGLDKEQLATAIAEKFAEVFGKNFDKIIERINARSKVLGEQMRTGQHLKNAQQQ